MLTTIAFALVAFLAAEILVLLGMLAGGWVRFNRFGSSGFALIGTASLFTLCVTIAVSAYGTTYSYLAAGLACYIFGIIMRGAAR